MIGYAQRALVRHHEGYAGCTQIAELYRVRENHTRGSAAAQAGYRQWRRRSWARSGLEFQEPGIRRGHEAALAAGVSIKATTLRLIRAGTNSLVP